MEKILKNPAELNYFWKIMSILWFKCIVIYFLKKELIKKIKIRKLIFIKIKDEDINATAVAYDIVFKGIERESVVMISTLGCLKNKDFFLKGYDEMLRRIKPQLIIVVGKIVEGMTGNIIPFDYTETFSKKDEYEQLKLFEIDRILRINGGDDING